MGAASVDIVVFIATQEVLNGWRIGGNFGMREI